MSMDILPGMGDLAGRHALVTGGGSGIGAAIAVALAGSGARITVLGRNAAKIESLAASLPKGGLSVAADVTDADAVAAAMGKAVAAQGPIDILINNAGQAASAPLLKTELELWQRMLAVNLTGNFLCLRAVLPAMLERGWGRIVNVASTAGLTGYRYTAAYCAAKHGVIGLTRSAALEIANRGVTINAVCPGFTETDMLSATIDNIVAKTGRTPEQARAELARGNPQNRLAQPEEVANAVLRLCGTGSAAINGQSISVSGGEVM